MFILQNIGTLQLKFIKFELIEVDLKSIKLEKLLNFKRQIQLTLHTLIIHKSV